MTMENKQLTKEQIEARQKELQKVVGVELGLLQDLVTVAETGNTLALKYLLPQIQDAILTHGEVISLEEANMDKRPNEYASFEELEDSANN